MYVVTDWTARDVVHLSLVPVLDSGEALCGALVASAASAADPVDDAAVRRCARCGQRARLLNGESRRAS